MISQALVEETKKTIAMYPAEVAVSLGLAALFPFFVYWEVYLGGVPEPLIGFYLSVVALAPGAVFGVLASSLHFHLGAQDSGDRLIQTFFIMLGMTAGGVYLSAGEIPDEQVLANAGLLVGAAALVLLFLIPSLSKVPAGVEERVRRSLGVTMITMVALLTFMGVGSLFLVELLDSTLGRWNLASYVVMWFGYGLAVVLFPLTFLSTFRALSRRRGGRSTPMEL